MDAVAEMPIHMPISFPVNSVTPAPASLEKKRELLLDALKTALGQAGDHRLFRSGRLSGLFPSKHGESGEAARQALAAGLLVHVRTEMRGKFLFEWVRATPRTAGFVAEHDSPKAILRELHDVLGETRAGVPIWMEQSRAELRAISNQFESRASALLARLDSLAARVEDALRRAEATKPQRMGAIITPWAESVLMHLDRRTESGSRSCPLSELFHVVRETRDDLAIGEFHDGIHRLAEAGVIQLAEGTDDPEYAVVWDGKLCQIAMR